MKHIIVLAVIVSFFACEYCDVNSGHGYITEPYPLQKEYRENCVTRTWDAMGMAQRLGYLYEGVTGWRKQNDGSDIWHVQCRWEIGGRWYWIEKIDGFFMPMMIEQDGEILPAEFPGFDTREGRVYYLDDMEEAFVSYWRYGLEPTVK